MKTAVKIVPLAAWGLAAIAILPATLISSAGLGFTERYDLAAILAKLSEKPLSDLLARVLFSGGAFVGLAGVLAIFFTLVKKERLRRFTIYAALLLPVLYNLCFAMGAPLSRWLTGMAQLWLWEVMYSVAIVVALPTFLSGAHGSHSGEWWGEQSMVAMLSGIGFWTVVWIAILIAELSGKLRRDDIGKNEEKS